MYQRRCEALKVNKKTAFALARAVLLCARLSVSSLSMELKLPSNFWGLPQKREAKKKWDLGRCSAQDDTRTKLCQVLVVTTYYADRLV